MKFKTYIRKPPIYKFMQWDGESIDEIKAMFPEYKFNAGWFPGDGNLFELSVQYGPYVAGHFTIEIGDYICRDDEHIRSGGAMIHIDKKTFEAIYEPIEGLK